MHRFGLVVPFMLFASFNVHAEEAERYRLEKTDGGYIRMDTQSGEMSICREESGQLVCRLAADERSAFEDEVDRLNVALKALEDRVAALEKAGPSSLDSMLPSDEQVDKAMSMMERFFRGFVDIVKQLDPSLDDGDSKPAEPQRT
jgi:hypothetical protein